MADFYSDWSTPPNGGAKYRAHLEVSVESQDITANQSTVTWTLWLEKDRSFNGFYEYYSNVQVYVNGSHVADAPHSQNPLNAWTGWSRHMLAANRLTVAHGLDGTKDIAVSASYGAGNTGWAIGTVSLSGTMALPTIPRATTPTVAPSPASVGATVAIDLPRLVGTYTHDVTWVSGALSGTVGTGLGTSATWTVPNVMGEFPGRAQAPITITAATKSGSTVIGSKSVTLFARNVPVPVVGSNLNEVPLDPQKQFDVRARVVSHGAGGSWGPVGTVAATGINMVDSASATTTCSLGVSRLITDIADDSIIDIDVYNGTDWVYTNHRFVLSRDEGDEIDPSGVRSFSGVEFIDYVLARAYVQDEQDWTASAVTPGYALLTLIDAAKARGWAPVVDFDFTATETTFGEPWANTTARRVSAGTPISQVLSGMVDDGLVEYRTEYRDNKAFLVLMNPGTGSNYAVAGANPTVNFGLAKLARAPRRNTSESVLDSVTVAGDESVKVTRKRAPRDPDVFGLMEGWVAASGVETEAEASTIGDNALRDNSTRSSERTFEYSSAEVAPVFYPYHIFIPGDWVRVPDGDSSIQDRLSQITIDKTSDGISLTALTGDRILSGVASLAKRQAAQTGGAIAGGNQTSLSPLDSRIPAAPVISTVTSAGYWNTDGAAQSAVTIGWGPVSSAISGTDITVDLYEVWWRAAGVGAQWSLRGTTADTSIEMGGWDVLLDLEFRVRARSAAGVFGEFSENEEHTTAAPAVDLDGPVIADIYTDGLGSIYVVWAGALGTDPYPARMAYVVAEVSDDGGTTYSTSGTPITAAGTLVINPGAWGDFKVRLRPYDRLGNAGDASAPESISLVDPMVLPPRRPVAPTSLASTAGAAWDAAGVSATAWFDLTWAAPTVDTEGDPITTVGYDLWGKRDTEAVLRFLTSSPTNAVRWPVGIDETWGFQVRAASQFGGVSEFSAAIVDTADATIPAPVAPDAPTLSQYAGILRIKWSGNGMVPQVRQVFASISSTLTGTYSRVGMPLLGAGEIVVPGLAPGNYYAKINMIDERGQIVSSTAAGPLTLLPITGVTVQTSEIANTGIKMTNASLTAYDVSGNPTFILDAGTGAVWIAPYDAVFEFGAAGVEAETGDPTTGLAVSSEDSPFNTFVHPAGLQIRNDQTPLSWWEADATDASLVNFFAPRAVFDSRIRLGDLEGIKEAKSGGGTRLVFRYKGN